MVSYKNYVDKEELIPRGYDLMADGVLDDTHFTSRDEAADDFMQNCFNQVTGLITKYRGRTWTNAFLTDMQQNDLTGRAKEFQVAFHDAILEQCIYTYDCGDASASAYKGESQYAPKAVELLWGLVI